MLKHLGTLLLVGLATLFVSPAVAQQPPPGVSVGHPDVQNGAFHRLALWIPPANGMPLRTQRPLSARSISWRDGHYWYRYRDHGRRSDGMGRLCTNGRSTTRIAIRHLCGCEWRRRRWRRRRRQSAIRWNGTFDRLAAALPRGLGRDQFVAWSFKPHAFLGAMNYSQRASLTVHHEPAASSTTARFGASHQRTYR
ncbi:hypothetical protein ACVWWG_001230 [Bradyrhizobium sp. LB7.2]